MKSKIWDLPVRLFHIAIIVLAGVSWWSAEKMHEISTSAGDYLSIHVWSGCTILTLVLFRIVWGFVGSTNARFSHFVKGPAAVVSYTKSLFSSEHRYWPGHNPLGGWSVVLMLLLLLAMPVVGLFSADDDLPGFGPSGPLSRLVSDNTSYLMAHIHHLLFSALQVVVVVHVAAVLFYLLVKRQNLIRAMVTGAGEAEGADTLRFRPLWLALVLLALTAGLVAAVVVGLS
ncbi:MAG: Ni/Fe-hydrogenase 1 b-type cytochrome subunit [Alphaproteobacteria bacterium]|nr:Ni/Fe-hydrogenase 1 b-type cytochrome subunit [Alphaproteobacteria bacterium]